MMTFDVAFVAFRAGQADAALAALAALSEDEHVEAIRQALDVLADLPVGEAGLLLVALEPVLMRAVPDSRPGVRGSARRVARANRSASSRGAARGWFTLAGPVYLSYTARATGIWPGRTYELRRSADHARLWAGEAPMMRLGLCCLLRPWATIVRLSGVDDDAAADLGLRVLSMGLNNQFRLPPYTLAGLADGLAALQADEATVLRLCYGLGDGRPRSLSRIGKEIQRTLETVRRWRIRGERRLAHALRAAAGPEEGDVCGMS